MAPARSEPALQIVVLGFVAKAKNKPSPASSGRGGKLKRPDPLRDPGTRRLKVFRTPIGFHDAYVAAPSMKAALAAWGADSNLFAQGIAEAVTDPKLITAALARPGEVVRVARGSAAEHVEAAGKAGTKAGGSRTRAGMTEAGGGRKSPSAATRSSGRVGSSGGRSAADRSPRKLREDKRPPKPDGSAVDAAEEALKELDRRHRAELREIDRAIAELERRRRQAERKYAVDREETVARRDKAGQAYRRAMEAWRG